jgi:hypothetical protein
MIKPFLQLYKLSSLKMVLSKKSKLEEISVMDIPNTHCQIPQRLR